MVSAARCLLSSVPLALDFYANMVECVFSTSCLCVMDGLLFYRFFIKPKPMQSRDLLSLPRPSLVLDSFIF